MAALNSAFEILNAATAAARSAFGECACAATVIPLNIIVDATAMTTALLNFFTATPLFQLLKIYLMAQACCREL
jgi:hypothetical protein